MKRLTRATSILCIVLTFMLTACDVEDPDPAIDNPIEMAEDPDPAIDCEADFEYESPISSRETCADIDIFDADDCTPAQLGVACRQVAQCGEEVFDRGDVTRCCTEDGWRTVFEEPDVCGLPRPEG